MNIAAYDKYRFLFIAWLVAELFVQPGWAEDPKQATAVVIVVPDLSASMGNGRLDQAIAEVKAAARRLPPSAATPWVVSPFRDKAERPRRFADSLATLESYLGQLKADGQTSIASGLAMAEKIVKHYESVEHLVLILYSDGKDQNTQGIMDAYKRLDRRFAARSAAGRSQTVIARRWESANAELIAQMSRSRHARLIDAGEARLSFQPIDLQLAVKESRWIKAGETLEVDLELRGGTAVSGRSALSSPIVLQCLSTRLASQSELTVRPGEAKTTSIRVAVSTDQLSARQIPLDFIAKSPPVLRVPNGIVVPSLVREKLRVDVPLPEVVYGLTVSAELSLRGHCTWEDPIKKLVRCPVKIAIATQSEPATGRGTMSTIWLVPKAADPALQFESDSAWEVSLNKSSEVELDIIVPMTSETGNSREISFAVVPRDLSPNYSLVGQPPRPSLIVESPAPVETAITVTSSRVSSVRWFDANLSIGQFEVALNVLVDGPLPDGTLLAVSVCDDKDVTIVGNTSYAIGAGRQTLEVSCRSKLTPNQTASYQFQLQAPTPATIKVPRMSPVEINLKAPRALQLALAQNGKLSAELRAKPTSGGTQLILEVEPLLLDGTNVFPAEINAEIAVLPPLRIKPPETIRLGRKQQVVIDLPSSARRLSLFDRSISTSVTLAAVDSSPAILAATQRLDVVIESPFKSQLPMATGLLFLAAIAWGTIRFERRK